MELWPFIVTFSDEKEDRKHAINICLDSGLPHIQVAEIIIA